MTLAITAGAAALATPVAVLSGAARLSRFRYLRWCAVAYVEVFRGTSALVQLFWFYFVLPHFGIKLNAMAVGICVLGLNAGAYGSEVMRGSLASIPKEQRQAAEVLNFSSRQIFWRILLPQAVLVALPSYGNILIELLKSTALVSLITLADLTFVAQTLRAGTLKTTEIFSLTLLLYFAAALLMTLGVRSLEKKLGSPWRQGKAV